MYANDISQYGIVGIARTQLGRGLSGWVLRFFEKQHSNVVVRLAGDAVGLQLDAMVSYDDFQLPAAQSTALVKYLSDKGVATTAVETIVHALTQGCQLIRGAKSIWMCVLPVCQVKISNMYLIMTMIIYLFLSGRNGWCAQPASRLHIIPHSEQIMRWWINPEYMATQTNHRMGMEAYPIWPPWVCHMDICRSIPNIRVGTLMYIRGIWPGGWRISPGCWL